MSDSPWQRAKSIFLRCLEQPDERQRAFIAVECGDDDALRREVEQLLAGHRDEARVFDHSETPPATSDDSDRDLIEVRAIPGYDIQDKIGEGGFGVVYLAEQREPRRRVALKLTRTGLHGDEYRVRFEAERQALAVMNHPSVAKVFDAGTTASTGRPYFVMEYIDGATLTDYCEQHRLSVAERLRLFIRVCDGVHHAHTKGIIHRDLKPANVLVTSESGRATPKIIDFGVAKTIGQRLTEQTLHTEYGQLIGTLDYMSPEQAELSPEDIDTRTDLYSLGVILYELLTHRRPVDVSQHRDSGYSAVQRAILEDDPVAPSARVLADSEDAATRSLAKELRGDLDWITLRALEKDRSRRYASAAEFAADLQRHLDDEPVSAGPPSTRYRFGKFCRKRPALVVAITGAVLSLLAGVALLIWANYEITLERNDAQDARDAAQRMSEELLGLADIKRLADANAAAAELRSFRPESKAALREWLATHGEPLASRLPEHERVLDELRRHAEPWSAEEQANDRTTHPNVEQLQLLEAQHAKLTRYLTQLDAGEEPVKHAAGGLERMRRTIGEELEDLAASIDRVEASIGARRSFTFLNAAGNRDDEAQWAHDTRASLVAGLHQFRDSDRYGVGLGSVRWHLDECERLERESLTNTEATRRWDKCIAAIAADDETYGELTLKPQFGLLPLDRNPRTNLWEFIHLASGTAPEPNPDWVESIDDQKEQRQFNRWLLTEDTGIVLVLLPRLRGLVGAERPLLEVEFRSESLVVETVPESSFGHAVGLAVGDRVVEVNGTTVDTPMAIRSAMSRLRSGDPVHVVIERGDDRLELTGALPPSNYDPNAELNESPVAEVELDAFFLAKYEVTQSQWRRLTDRMPAFINPIDYPNLASRMHPVEQVNWNESQEVLTRIGLGLPTEAQWEVACRAGSPDRYWSGEKLSPQQANIAGESYRQVYDRPRYGERDWDDGYGAHAPIGSFLANGLGLHDVHGNVWEWCRDRWSEYETPPDPGDGLRAAAGDRGRLFRGGSFLDPSFIVRASYRNQQLAEFRYNTIGVRPAAAVRK